MRALLHRAIAGLFGCTPGIVQSDATGRLSTVDAPTGRALLNACADDDPRLSATGGIPAGVIVMWSGLLANVPSGWALCDGTNGTPDLRDRFIKGAAGEPGATGGAATHQHTYTDVPNHTHPVNVNDPGHTHVEQNNSATTGGLAGWAALDTSTNTPVATGYSTLSATTGITATTSNPAGGVAQGTTSAAGTEPPYYELAFIIKL
jgi:microcystin-dependent protein